MEYTIYPSFYNGICSFPVAGDTLPVCAFILLVAIGDDTQKMKAAYQKYIHVAEKSANTIWEEITSPYMGIDDVRWFLLQAGKLEEYISLNGQLFDYIWKQM